MEFYSVAMYDFLWFYIFFGSDNRIQEKKEKASRFRRVKEGGM